MSASSNVVIVSGTIWSKYCSQFPDLFAWVLHGEGYRVERKGNIAKSAPPIVFARYIGQSLPVTQSDERLRERKER